eukprot:GEMP01035303.1.p1 GENE.GEMP01035303.1~~GEMP01035303.1.p1  ORF type:complete len:454 (+),score=97.40 GEMP01035303.1:207-1568(+)
MWAFDFLSAEPKAKSLKTHLVANNAFARWWVAEYYLPEDMRLSAWLRFLVLVQTLSIYLVVVSVNVVLQDSDYMRECRDRETCLAACINDNFPELPCVANPNFKISYGENSYVNLYEWREKPDSEEKVLSDLCRATFPDAGKTERTRKRELFDRRQPRTQVCFPYCFPDAEDSLYKRNWTDNAKIAHVDNRPAAGSAECEASGSKASLLCVDPDPSIEYCEKMKYEKEYCVGEEEYLPWKQPSDPACFQPTIVLLCCLLAIPFQNLVDMILLFTLGTRAESIQDFRPNAMRCASQCAHLFVSSILVLLLTSSVYNVYGSSRPNLMWFTWIVAIAIDQVRNLIVQTFTWYFLIRRCGQVPLMDEAEEYQDSDDGQEKLSPMDVFLRLVTMLVESRRFDMGTWITISLYAVYLITVMSIDEYITKEPRDALELGDTVFLGFFILEIKLRIIGQGI